MSGRRACATAHPNIALAKYWGKAEGGARMPAVPSLSVTLAGMATTTTVAFDDALPDDALTIGSAPQVGRPLDRARELLDRVRARAGVTSRARIESASDFPTAAGLASSASGFAALAVAATAAAGLTPSAAELSDLARQSSVSAARSLFGGFVELPLAPAGAEELAAVPVADPIALDLRIVVAVTAEGEKAVSSSVGMLATQRHSPYYPAWVADAPTLFARIKRAILDGDFRALGEAAELSALRMHAAALANEPPLLYWNGATVSVLAAVSKLRADGLAVYATIDAGPHVKVLVPPAQEADALAALAALPGVLRTISTRPGPGARVVPAEGLP